MRALVITGNPVDGFEYIGPFDDTETAVEWCQDMFDDEDWWVTELTSPASIR